MSAHRPVIARQHAIQLRTAIPEDEPVVTQLFDLGEIEFRNQHCLVFLVGLGHFGASRIRDEARAVEPDIQLLGVLTRALDTDAVVGTLDEAARLVRKA